MKETGYIRKLKSEYSDSDVVSYSLPMNATLVSLNKLIGQDISLRSTGLISCIHCSRSIKKTFNQGYCFPCVRALAQCDVCIVKPELCHYSEGTCREPTWGEEHCMIPHTIYLANSSGLKVGITRSHQRLTRWIDQGASEALVIGEVPSRKKAGLIEVEIAKSISDKTNWRKMLKGAPEPVNLIGFRDSLIGQIKDIEPSFKANEQGTISIRYPVEKYPEKISSYNLDKTPHIQDRLEGIKGQYLIFAKGVLNIRKYAGYEIELSQN